MSDIFISYAREDQAFARQLAGSLEKYGWLVWWDRTIRPEEVYEDVIGEALEAARCVVVIWSKSSVSSEWVKMEAGEGRDSKILVPVLIDSAKIPWTYRRLQTATLSGWSGDLDHRNFRHLLTGIEKILGKPPEQQSQPVKKAGAHRKPSRTTQKKHKASLPAPYRGEPRVLSDEDVRTMLRQHDLFDRRKNPEGKGSNHIFERRENTVVDHDGGLTWQQSGSENYSDFGAAEKYVKELNDQEFAGFDNWRLPTLEEAMSLMRPVKNDSGSYIDPIFDSRQQWIWTADTESASVAWVVYFCLGPCAIGRLDGNAYVRAVRRG